MTIWSGIGINYGHQATYDTTQTESDFTYLRALGVSRLRIAMPPYDGNLTDTQDMVHRALSHGFYVVWGVATSGTVTATIWNAFKAFVTGTLATWAQSNSLPEFSLGNEIELYVDGTTLTAATVRADVRTMASTVKSGGYTGKVSYGTSILDTYKTPWISEGIGSLDLIGWNSYDTYANFNTQNGAVQSAFGNKTYISEFGSSGGGYPDFNNEQAFYYDTARRITSMQTAGIQFGYFFCYRDGGFGMPADTFALQLSGGATRTALYAVLGSLSSVNHGLYGHG